MTAPTKHEVVLNPPRPGIESDKREIYKYLYEIWKRTGGYESQVKDLSGLEASVRELNTLVGIRTDETVQAQLNLKANTADLGTMAFQNENAVSITGGSIADTAISGGTIADAVITNSSLTVPAGLSLETAKTGGVLDVNTTSIGNVGASETTLISYTLKGDTLDTNTSYIKIHAWGTFNTNGNNKRVRMKIGTTTISDSGTQAANGGDWSLTGKIVRKSITTGSAIIEQLTSNVLFTNQPFFTSLGENFGVDLNVFCTGQGFSNDDIVQEGLIIEWN